ncbi:MAG: hypothetical protein A2927_02615 [Candidatus Komeilibacteria bacterium RIFCSPLOWO2_01_FULL_45_10]|uniref:RNase H type-1 domain-containing protein n=1 Tax=Candidatus Komeilibacteria bacterium RIFCSPLOWO2_01_FULL_45_10 TaxID=1798550 RepID=A0A1G2BJK4_9BACT|nr:MAG: hypothetical protein A2927_02615 [Candidatus Komeilibacteria bacterium RIFCSPLOWO2_01_FULL_45_10]
MIERVKIYTDGGARGNPGPAACGAVIKNPAGRVLKKVSRFLGHATNNQAEYEGVLLGLKAAKELPALTVDFFLDSELIANQLSRNFKVKDLALQSLFVKIWNLSLGFKKIKYHHIPREENKEADWLVNQELDRH